MGHDGRDTGMERLTRRDLRAVVDFLADGYGVGDLDAFAAHLLRALPRLVPCASVSYNEINTHLGRMAWIAEPDGATRFPGCEEIVARHIGEHPVVQRALRTRQPEWSRISDLVTLRQWRHAPLYHEFYRRVSVHYQMGILYPERGGVSMAIALNRDVRDFSDRDRTLLEALRPHIQRAYGNAQALTLLKGRLALLECGVEAAALGLVTLGGDGRLTAATETAQRWLQAYFGWKRGAFRLPPPLATWLATSRMAGAPPLVVGRGATTLVVRRVRQRGQDCLVLQETRRTLDPAPLAAHGLTTREIEVLGWVGEGKTSPEIAAILGVSPRTIHHHLDSVYRKLGVETRTAAVRRAREIGGGPA
jgi:DNA-binding CsgD family transcriptional regulator